MQHRSSGTEGEIVTMFHICLDTELVTQILVAHLETVVMSCSDLPCCQVEDVCEASVFCNQPSVLLCKIVSD